MSEVKGHLSSIDGHLATAKLEEEKLSKGCKASAARCRNSLLEIGKICSEARKDVLEIGKAVPTKKRAPKDPKDEVQPDEVESSSDDSEEKKEAQPVSPPDAIPMIGQAPVVAPVAVAPVKKTRAPRAKKGAVSVAPSAPIG